MGKSFLINGVGSDASTLICDVGFSAGRFPSRLNTFGLPKNDLGSGALNSSSLLKSSCVSFSPSNAYGSSMSTTVSKSITSSSSILLNFFLSANL
jgi:hypothetical protein